MIPGPPLKIDSASVYYIHKGDFPVKNLEKIRTLMTVGSGLTQSYQIMNSNDVLYMKFVSFSPKLVPCI